jgi:uncharacterized repeat protein (TIGR01451 family)
MKQFESHAARLGVALAILSSIGWAAGAQAAGTAANTTVSNSATVSYSVGAVAQTPITSNTSTFLVDRKVNLNVTAGSGTSVTPGSTAQAVIYTVTNTGNDTDNFTLAATNQTGDNFDVSNVKIYRDNGDNVFNPATDTLVSAAVAFTADQSIKFFIVSDIPGTALNAQTGVVNLKATTGHTATVGADTAGVDTVFADTGNDGTENANNTYTVASATLAVVKSVAVISDPVNGATNPKAIPGAIMEYTITVTNSSTTTAATAATLADNIPANTTYVAGSMKLNGTTLTDAADADGGTTTGSPVTSISVTAGTIAASGGVATVKFRVTVN